MAGYSILLPPPWKRIPLSGDRGQAARRFLDQAMSQAPKHIPPDQLAVTRGRLEHELNAQLTAAREHGGLDFSAPAHDLGGVSLNASFVVSAVVPDSAAGPQLVAPTLAELVAGGGAAITIADTVWVRTEQVLSSDGEQVQAGLRSRRIEYLTAVPAQPRRWVVVSCTVLGDGDPDSLPTGLVTELFDAIMTTWRWQEEEPRPGEPAGERS